MITLREPETWLHIARVFDGYSEDLRGLFTTDHPRATDPDEKARILRFLRGGEPVFAYRCRSHDQITPAPVPMVPMVFATDGEWVWSMGTAYYLDVHGLLPESRFLDHIVARGYHVPALDEETLERVEEEFTRVLDAYPVDGTQELRPPPH
jgi:hypothetical protein